MPIKGLDAYLTTDPNIDQPDAPCAICGKFDDDCTCLPCDHVVSEPDDQYHPIFCDVQGCVEHLSSSDLAQKINILTYQLVKLTDEATRREKPTLPCPKCGTIHKEHIFQEEPLYCCTFEYIKGKWEPVYDYR